jgi:hypothetical protein
MRAEFNMKKFTILAGVALLATAGAASAQPADGARGQRNVDLTRQQIIERTDQRFEKLDLNNDGRVTAEEAQQARAQRSEQRAERAFERLDLDRNGSIERVEFEQARAHRAERRAERGERRGGRHMARRGQRAHGIRAERLFREQGFITREQFQERALVRFDRLDTDRNGTVTVAERQERFEQRRERRQARRNRAD